jgi:hypothetical protein
MVPFPPALNLNGMDARMKFYRILNSRRCMIENVSRNIFYFPTSKFVRLTFLSLIEIPAN